MSLSKEWVQAELNKLKESNHKEFDKFRDKVEDVHKRVDNCKEDLQQVAQLSTHTARVLGKVVNKSELVIYIYRGQKKVFSDAFAEYRKAAKERR